LKQAHSMMSLEEARQTMLSRVSRLSDTDVTHTDVTHIDTKPLSELSACILAENITSPLNSPPADNSAMDGYALRYEDIEPGACFPVVGKSLAGKPYQDRVEANQCVRITTGASMPEGADTVVIQEDVTLEPATAERGAGNGTGNDAGDGIRVQEWPSKQGANVRYCGEDVSKGDIVLNAGRRLGAIELGILATLGIAEARVYRALRVAIFVSGDELRAPGETLKQGEIYESNRYVLREMLQKLDVEIIDLGVVPDIPERLREACLEGQRRADVVISCGGASVGEADYTRDILQELGEIEFWKVAIKPGKPFIFGHLDDTLFFGLPGNPVSALVTFHQLVAPVLRKLQGADDPEALSLTARSTQIIRPNRQRLELMRAHYRPAPTGEGFEVTPDRQQSSGAFASLARCNCFILLDAGSEELLAGAILAVLPFDELLGRGAV